MGGANATGKELEIFAQPRSRRASADPLGLEAPVSSASSPNPITISLSAPSTSPRKPHVMGPILRLARLRPAYMTALQFSNVVTLCAMLRKSRVSRGARLPVPSAAAHSI